MKVSQKQMAAVLGLPGAKRSRHFIKVIADREEVWGLYKDGWALAAAGDNGTIACALWAAKEYAEICVANEWKRYEPRSMDWSDSVNVLLPSADGVLPGVFFAPSNKRTTPSVEDLLIGRLSADSSRRTSKAAEYAR